jgi:hypothetical protein
MSQKTGMNLKKGLLEYMLISFKIYLRRILIYPAMNVGYVHSFA